ncbi:MAG: hypothetical protein ABSA14_07670 [Acidimicrobiales bacterium]
MSITDRPRFSIPARPLAAPSQLAEVIAAAVAACWPKGTGQDDPRTAGLESSGDGSQYVWRFSGRWWQAPAARGGARSGAQVGWR